MIAKTPFVRIACLLVPLGGSAALALAFSQGGGDPTPTPQLEGARETAEWFEDGNEGTNEEAKESLETFESIGREKLSEDFWNGGASGNEVVREIRVEAHFKGVQEEMHELGKLQTSEHKQGSDDWFNSSPPPDIF